MTILRATVIGLSLAAIAIVSIRFIKSIQNRIYPEKIIHTVADGYINIIEGDKIKMCWFIPVIQLKCGSWRSIKNAKKKYYI